MTSIASLRVTDPGAARALRQHHDFLTLFIRPQSPSDVAVRAGMAANLAHHHARRLAALGLLREQRREGRRVYYQLTAHEFRVPWDVMPPTDTQGGELADLGALTTQFRRAYEHAVATAGTDEKRVVAFIEAPEVGPPLPAPVSPPVQTHPAHLDALTVRVSPARYRSLVRAISALLDEAARESRSGDAAVCTVAVLAYRGALDEGTLTGHIARRTSSFLGAD
ncbi:DNA-binding transcriptional ArsR family regulator [Deinococcus metalli]|uniref:DNA-binding transcriptional ArsR family regulator n=1 Tax=Deinococcus metalli TaxID=1141878 RepID=A0A7W8KFV3_9DEIO|nr:winged helix-turn-helix domain-containing protein [Deinococcus metalli]MBB5376343.1 DNA-binding transcriptional ArsR family regulator [Deinococcus metalli]GHF38996.1 transcriptional regulator [Deinococcus metalli]